MVILHKIAIETFIKPMKIKKITHAIGELDSRKLEINLDNLHITFGYDCFDLIKIPGTKGGERYFFLCPRCGKRCRILYKYFIYYACGKCQGAYTKTLNRSKTDCQYYWERALREARKVDPDWSPKRGGYMFDGFPSRPKYMKRDKYYRHYQKFVNYVRKGDSFWVGRLPE